MGRWQYMCIINKKHSFTGCCVVFVCSESNLFWVLYLLVETPWCSLNKDVFNPVCLSVCLSFCLFVCLSVCLLVCVSVYF